jgi:hypothetical protein
MSYWAGPFQQLHSKRVRVGSYRMQEASNRICLLFYAGRITYEATPKALHLLGRQPMYPFFYFLRDRLIRYFGHHSHYDLVKTSIFGQILKNFQV